MVTIASYSSTVKRYSEFEAAVQVGMDKRKAIGSIEIPRMLSDFICYQEVSGESHPKAHVDRQLIIEH